MSEVDNTSIGSKAAGYLAFPTVFAAPDIVRGIKYSKSGALGAFKELETNLIEKTSMDVFQRSNILAQNYDAYKAATKIPLKDKFLNIFRKSADKKIRSATVEQAGNTLKINGKAVETAAQAGFKSNFKSLFTQGMKDKLGIAITVGLAIPEFTKKVIPEFKENGFGAGMKALGKFAVKTTTDFFSFVTGSALGTVVGSLLIPIPGVGAAIGKTFFGILGSSLMNGASTKVLNKVFKEDENSDKTEDNAQLTNQAANKKYTQEEALEIIRNKSYNPNFQGANSARKFNMKM